jgi:thiol-disulfide isomerase/thioredoxin
LIAVISASGPAEKRPPHIVLVATLVVRLLPRLLSFRREDMKRCSVWLLVTMLALAPSLAPGMARAASDADALRPLLTGGMAKFTLSDEAKPAPPATFKDADGRERTLADFKGRVVLVSLWATWCVPCRAEMPTLDALQAKLGGADFEVLAVSQDRAGPVKAKAFMDEIGVKHLPFYIDATMRSARAFGAYGLPTAILYGRDGREIGRVLGEADWSGAEAVKLIQAAIGAEK